MKPSKGIVVFENSPSFFGGVQHRTLKMRQGSSAVLVPRNISLIVTQEDSGFSAYSPDVKGAITQGETLEETLRNAVEAVKAVLEEKDEYVPFIINYRLPNEQT